MSSEHLSPDTIGVVFEYLVCKPSSMAELNDMMCDFSKYVVNIDLAEIVDDVTDDVLESLHKFGKLATINMKNCGHVSKDGLLRILDGSTSLKHINISDCSRIVGIANYDRMMSYLKKKYPNIAIQCVDPLHYLKHSLPPVEYNYITAENITTQDLRYLI